MDSIKRICLQRLFPALFVMAAVLGSAAQNNSLRAQTNTSSEFEKRVAEYVKLREKIEKKLPKLPKDASPGQIEAHKTAFQKAIRIARKTGKQSDIFTNDVALLIKTIIKNELKGQELNEFRASVFEIDAKSMAMRVNSAYPETIEQIEMPPDLLLSLPPLPEAVRYRFAGRTLLLLDRENELILDFILNALP